MIRNLPKIAIIGMGKVGLPLAVCYAHRGFDVIGVDTDRKRIELFKKGDPILQEPRLSKLFSENKKNINFTTDLSFAVKNSRCLFIIVPTPSQKDGSFSLKYVLDVCRDIGKELKKENSWKLINIISTIMPGSMSEIIRPAIEKETGKKAGKDFGLCYSPEFVALGNVISIIFNPDFILIGESDPKSGKLLESVKKQVILNKAPVHRTNFINAELTKIASNTFITTKISFANMLSRICEKTEEANIDTISSILADDSSIGGKRLKGGVSYGGPCYPRDNIALITYADKIGANSDIAQTTHRFNQQQSSYLTNLILSKYKKNNTVGILGLSYKPDTDVIDESAGLKLAIDLVKKNIPVILYDPKALENAKRVFRNKAIYSESLLEILDKSDILVITTPWKNFSVLDHIAWKKRKRKITLIDCWRMLNLKNTDIISYVPFGIGPQRVS